MEVRTTKSYKVHNVLTKHNIWVTYSCWRDSRSPKEELTVPVNPLDDKFLEQIIFQGMETIHSF